MAAPVAVAMMVVAAPVAVAMTVVAAARMAARVRRVVWAVMGA